MAINVDVSKLDELILLISNSVDEKQKRILLGKATEVYGRGGATHVKELTGVAFSTLHSGNIEANSEEGIVSDGRTRREGAGRKPFANIIQMSFRLLNRLLTGRLMVIPQKCSTGFRRA